MTEQVWVLPQALGVRRLAQSLVSDAQVDDIDKRRHDVWLLAVADPRRLVEVTLALAQLAAASLAPPVASDDPDYLELLRAAHAAYARGLRLAWVVEGERDYQREKKRRARERFKQARLGEAG